MLELKDEEVTMDVNFGKTKNRSDLVTTPLFHNRVILGDKNNVTYNIFVVRCDMHIR